MTCAETSRCRASWSCVSLSADSAANEATELTAEDLSPLEVDADAWPNSCAMSRSSF